MKLLSCLAAAIAVGAFAAPAASAATTIGDSCIGNTQEGVKTLVQLSQAGSTPQGAPEAGVITKWGVSVIPYPGGISEKLKVLRPAAGKNTFTVVSESTIQPVAGGVNTFDTRLPIQAGDRIGVVSPSVGTIYCNKEGGSAPTDVMGTVVGDSVVNSTVAFGEEIEAQAAVTATIEKDADGDGFGDETQDKCPQNAAVQIPCPVLNLDAISQPPGKTAVRILVTSGLDSSITVSATAKLPAKTKKAKASAQAKLAPISQLVTPGHFAIYTMNFPKSLKDSLASLPRKKSLALTVTVAGKTIDGVASSQKKLTVKLKGQAKGG
jgi:hypothetical protein